MGNLTRASTGEIAAVSSNATAEALCILKIEGIAMVEPIINMGILITSYYLRIMKGLLRMQSRNDRLRRGGGGSYLQLAVKGFGMPRIAEMQSQGR